MTSRRQIVVFCALGSLASMAIGVGVLRKGRSDASRIIGADLPDAADAARPSMAAMPFGPCQVLEAANEALLASMDARDAGDGCAFARPHMDCVTTSNGVTWGYRIASADARIGGTASESEERTSWCETKYELDLLREDGAGPQVVPTGHTALSYDRFTLENRIILDALADYDRDGEVEILRTNWTQDDEGLPKEERVVLTFKGGALVPYAPARGITIDATDDVDQDGLPDLISRGPYGGVVEDADSFHNERAIAPSIFAYVAQRDGTFKLGDAASIAFTRRRCDGLPTVTSMTVEDTTGSRTLDHSSLSQAIVCTLLRGRRGATRVVQAWNAVCAHRTEDEQDDQWQCQDWPKQLAAIAPPFVL